MGTNYLVGGELAVRANYHACSGNTVIGGGTGGIKFWLREITPGWGVAKDYTFSDDSAIGEESGTASAVISLEGVTPSAQLPEGNFYFLFLTMETSDAQSYDKGIFPINIVDPTSVHELGQGEQMEMFPNPARSVLHLKNLSLKQNYTVEIVATTGQVLQRRELSRQATDLTLNINDLPSGYYLLRLVADRVYAVPFVKE